MASFDISLRTVGSLRPDGDPGRFIAEFRGSILHTDDHDGTEHRVGRLRAWRIYADLSQEAGVPLFDVCDAHSQEMHELYTALFDIESDDLKELIQRRFETVDSDLLILDYVLLAPKWRGLKLGLLAARKLIDLIGGGCGLVVSDIAPLNPDAAEFRKVPKSWLPRANGEGEQRAARVKLRRYFKQMGFRRIGRSRFYGLSLTQVTPTLTDLLQPER